MKIAKKKCRTCGKKKTLDEFYDSIFKEKSRSFDGKYHACKECARASARRCYHKNFEKGRKKSILRNEEYRKKHPEVRVIERHRKLAREINIPYEEVRRFYNKQFMIQQAHCAICGKITEQLGIDHCHKTNKLRGLLCKSCNLAVGNLQDNSDICSKAEKYLKKCG